jgi:non-ribosomal peptide synthetase component E (peptide arylation enzyme)
MIRHPQPGADARNQLMTLHSGSGERHDHDQRVVEQALMSYPAIQDCAVVGLPDEKWGERRTAVLQLQSQGTLNH